MVWTSDILRITSSITLSTIQDVYVVDASGGNITLTLPNITTNGMQYKLKRVDSTRANTVTVQGFSGAQTIDGQVSITLSIVSSIEVQSINSVWVSLFKEGLVKNLLYFSNGGNNINLAQGSYMGQGNTSSGYGDVEIVAARTGTLTAIYATKNGTVTGTATLMKNNVATALTVDLAAPTGSNGSTLANVSVTAFDRLSVLCHNGNGTWSFAAATVIFEPS